MAKEVCHVLVTGQSDNGRSAYGERPALWRRSRLIPCRRVGLRPLGSIPPLSAHFLRRLAALKRVSLAHVTGLGSSASAAVCPAMAHGLATEVWSVRKMLETILAA